ncbi:hypothetical protein Mal15_11250 [Stieleria maiorica]|uniref:Uncharacterized protein n=1 Tax=Stieleria maiorica TaxID=2795974 RepID=A0A5B9MAK0_9BACT|nr:hypothetical protein [Stieleria maiorica]QEF97090.1 hypothetical protein Mal15_11250 [Stieleria maiorica]
MQKRTELKRQLLIAGCAGVMITFTGCRSAMPKWNMFSWRSAPSAETLAGNGPTITYPAPPGEAATPEAIASVAAGTSGSPTPDAVVAARQSPNAPVTGFDATVAAANRSTPSTNLAAAQANGFNVTSAAPASATPGKTVAANNSSVPSIPAGYQFGSKPSGQTSAAPSQGGLASRYAMPSSYPAPGASTSMPTSAPTGAGPSVPSTATAGLGTSSGYTFPSGATPTGTQTAAASAASGFGLPSTGAPESTPTASGNAASGFALPDSMLKTAQTASGTSSAGSAPTNPQPFMPKTTPAASPAASSIAGPAASPGFKLPGDAAAATSASTVSTGASTPSFSTASASLTPRSGETPTTNFGSGYTPGSTAGSGSYPTTSGYPSTGTEGSFYR